MLGSWAEIVASRPAATMQHAVCDFELYGVWIGSIGHAVAAGPERDGGRERSTLVYATVRALFDRVPSSNARLRLRPRHTQLAL